MKISLKWLKDFVDIQDMMAKPEVLAETLTKAGLEVEEISQKAKDFQFVVTGLILEKAAHPNANKLSVCRVTTGEGVVHQIVCGAQNHSQNDKVVVALPGAVLPGNFSIQKAVVRGVESGGMLCSLKELGLSSESAGIEILPSDAPIGKSFAEYRGFDDVIFELKVTPNRADCLSHYGLAREVACLLNRPLLKPTPQFQVVEGNTADQISLEIKSDLCPRYAGRFVRGVKIQPSPEWMQKRLESVGLNSINNVVDVTNYVMMELGQPLHAFDVRELKGQKIVVDMAKAGEKFKTLQDTEVVLTGEELMIRDGERPVAMAGVIGGKNSGVTDSTTDLFVEAAYFLPSAVRKASRAHGITTDSGYRFSRGVDPDSTVLAMDRAVQLILQVAGGETLAQFHDHYPQPVKKSSITTTLQTISDRLGYKSDGAKFESYMTRLGCKTTEADGKYQVLPPTFRFDLESEMDLVEEYARLNGYDQIPETLPAQKLLPTADDLQYVLDQKLSLALRSTGYSQALNMAFSGIHSEREFLGNLESLKKTGLLVSDSPVQILNPLSEEANGLRSSLVEGLYRNARQNFHQGVENGRLFEIGSVFSTQGGAHQEHHRLSLVSWGREVSLWEKTSAAPLVFEVKAVIESVLKQFHINSYQWVTPENRGDCPAFLHRGQNAILQVEGKPVGFLGSAHPSKLESDKIRVPLALAELDLSALYKGQPRGFKVESFSRFPKVERDLALVMPKALKAGEVLKEIKKVAGPHCLRVSIFDVYEGDKLPVGQKSVAFRLSYQDKNATLQDSVVNDSVAQVLSALQAKFGITVR